MINTRVRSFAFSGIEAIPVWIEVQIASGLPAFLIVGLPDKAVGEARERVRAALTSMGVALPPKRILINMVPADLQKEGSHFDLPVALALLAAMNVIPGEELTRYAAVGELSLDGSINRVPQVISASIAASMLEIGLICPKTQGREALFGGDKDVIAAPDLLSLVNHLRGLQVLTPENLDAAEPDISENNYADMADIRGMETARRAAEIAAAGGHSMLMSGPPGAGKSMLAARIPGLLPELSLTETLEVTRIYSAAGLLPSGNPIRRAPFRSPHHSASQPALMGGGARAKPGEVSLAHRGILFLDEMPEFSRQALEALRQPVETGEAVIARAAAHVTYPARFQLIAAMNPCRCGWLGDASRECRKAPRCGEDYLGKLSGPLIDRIDLWVPVQPVSPADMLNASSSETTATVAERVARARDRQNNRNDGIRNSEIKAELCIIHDNAKSLVGEIARSFRLSARGFTRLLRVARTIADLADSDLIHETHVSEAAAYRQRLH